MPPSLVASPLDIPLRTREHIANIFLAWFTNEDTQRQMMERTQRDVRNTLLRFIGNRGKGGEVGARIANELTRWIFAGPHGLQGVGGGGVGDIRELTFRESGECRRRVMKVIERALEREGAEKDEDITDDLYAPSYPRTYERLYQCLQSAVDFVKSEQRGNTPALVAEAHLVKMLKASLEDWEASA